jgi:signal-transduction protein with cAMP-binding, CBS, and nucleotidyltransferase domain
MKIKDKLDYEIKPKPFTLRINATVKDALDVMCEKNFGSIVIVHDNDTIAGILTERDMMRRVLHQGLDPTTTAITDVMSTSVHSANENDEFFDWLRIMTTERFRHLPIVDDEGKLVNMMSQGDFVSLAWPDLFDHTRQVVRERLGIPFQILMVGVAGAIITLLLLSR